MIMDIVKTCTTALHYCYSFPLMSWDRRSMGTGNTMVLLLSAEMLLRVCR